MLSSLKDPTFQHPTSIHRNNFPVFTFAPMQSLLEQIKSYESEINTFSPTDAAALEAYRIKFLGTKGIVKAIFGEMKTVPVEQKKEAGQVLNAFKQLAESKWEAFKHLQDSDQKAAAPADISLPG